MADSNKPSLPKSSGEQIGQSGTLIFNGIITAEEFNRNLSGKIGLKKYDTMRRSDSTVRSVLQVCKLPILSTTWSVEAAQVDPDDPEAKTKQDNADFKARLIERELFHRKLNWHDTLRSILTMLEFGHDVEEKVFEITEFEGKPYIGIEGIYQRKQMTIYSWKTEDMQPGITQNVVGNIISIPREKIMVFTNDKEGDNYEGISILRSAYKDWDIKDKLTIVNAIALEKMAIGVPIVKPTPNTSATEADLKKARNAVRNMRANEETLLELPAGLEIEMLDLKANSTKDVMPSIEYHDRQIHVSVLAQFLSLGASNAAGSRALSGDMTSLFMKAEESVANTIVSSVQEQLIKQLCDLNFSDMSEGYPQLKYGSIGEDDTTAISSSVSSLMTAGALTPDPDLEDHLRTLFKAPALPEDLRKDYAALHAKNPAAPAAVNPEDDPTLKKDPTTTDPKKASLLAEATRIERELTALILG